MTATFRDATAIVLEEMRIMAARNMAASTETMLFWQSLLEKPFMTSEEAREAFGTNWVIFARRTSRIIDRYGENVRVVTPRQYREAEQRALLGRREKINSERKAA